MAKKRAKKSPIERAIFSRECGIKRMQDRILAIKRRAASEVEAIERRVAERQILLDALKRGQIKQ